MLDIKVRPSLFEKVESIIWAEIKAQSINPCGQNEWTKVKRVIKLQYYYAEQ